MVSLGSPVGFRSVGSLMSHDVSANEVSLAFRTLAQTKEGNVSLCFFSEKEIEEVEEI